MRHRRRQTYSREYSQQRHISQLPKLKKDFSNRSTPKNRSATPPATKPRSNPKAAPPKEEIIPLMKEVVRPNSTLATQSSFCDNVKRMSELMKIGQLYYLNEEEYFFKLQHTTKR